MQTLTLPYFSKLHTVTCFYVPFSQIIFFIKYVYTCTIEHLYTHTSVYLKTFIFPKIYVDYQV